MESAKLTQVHEARTAALAARGIETAVTTERAALLLGLSPKTLHDWAQNESGPIRPVRMGRRHILWRTADLRKAVTQSAHDALAQKRACLEELAEPLRAIEGRRSRLESKRLLLDAERVRLDAERARLEAKHRILNAEIEAASKEEISPAVLCLNSGGVEATLTTEECAIALGLQSQTLHKWACKGNGPIQPVRVGRRLAWSAADVRALLAGGAK